MKEKYEIIQNNLEKIKRLDPKFETNGSTCRKYSLERKIESEIALCEIENNITLPHEFKEFIAELGFGASPVNGVSPLALIKVNKWEKDDIDEVENEENYIEFKPLYDGYIIIAEYGCGITSVIIVDGEHKGEVWHYGDFGMYKLNESYYDWYLKWTEDLIKYLETGEQTSSLTGFK